MSLEAMFSPGTDRLGVVAEEFDRRGREITTLRNALAEAEAERIALADGWRQTLVEAMRWDPTEAALYVQNVIDNAEAKQ